MEKKSNYFRLGNLLNNTTHDQNSFQMTLYVFEMTLNQESRDKNDIKVKIDNPQFEGLTHRINS